MRQRLVHAGEYDTDAEFCSMSGVPLETRSHLASDLLIV